MGLPRVFMAVRSGKDKTGFGITQPLVQDWGSVERGSDGLLYMKLSAHSRHLINAGILLPPLSQHLFFLFGRPQTAEVQTQVVLWMDELPS